MWFCEAKRLVERIHRLLLDRGLHMQVVLRHIQIRVTDHALDRGEIHTQRLRLTDINLKNEFCKNEQKEKNGSEPHMKNVQTPIRFFTSEALAHNSGRACIWRAISIKSRA